MGYKIDINCDMGEYDRPEDCANDVGFMPHISRCNIAVGGHTGNPETIAISFRNAARHNLKIGIHPSYPDRQHFGRQRPDISINDLLISLAEQVELGFSIAEQEGISLSHLKFHGALYNHLEQDQELAMALADWLTQFQPLTILGMANGQFQTACQAQNLPYLREAFMDRRYVNQHQLQPRAESGAVLTDQHSVIEQAVAIASQQPISSACGDALTVTADSLCVHSDTDGALALLKAVRSAFDQHDIKVV